MTTRNLQRANLLHFIELGRPLHLVGGVLFYFLGISCARYLGVTLDWTLILGGQVLISASQLMTHYSNEYFDLESDRANSTPSQWSGGSRVLVNTDLPPVLALRAALVFGLIASTAAVFVITQSSAPLQTAMLATLAIGLAWSYSSPPLLLNRRALGEITGGILVPGLTALLGYQLQAASIDVLPLLVIVPLCCFQFLMLLAINFPDAASDAATGKITLVVRLGAAPAARLYMVVLIATYVVLPLLWWAGLPGPVILLMLVAAPIAIWLGWCMGHGGWNKPAAWDALGFWGIGLLIGTALLQFVGFLLIT